MSGLLLKTATSGLDPDRLDRSGIHSSQALGGKPANWISPIVDHHVPPKYVVVEVVLIDIRACISLRIVVRLHQAMLVLILECSTCKRASYAGLQTFCCSCIASLVTCTDVLPQSGSQGRMGL